jgi:hypothetical protein
MVDMKKLKIVGVALLGAVGCAFGQQDSVQLNEVYNQAFVPGEKLTYLMHYGFFDAGEAVLEVKPSSKTYFDRNTWHMVGNGYSTGAFDWFFKVRDTYETYMDAESMVPWEFIRNVDEGGYTINQRYMFDHFNKRVTTDKKDTIAVKPNVQDMISSFYYARTLNYDTAKAGDIYTIDAIVDGEYFPLKIKYIGKEAISLRNGKYQCIKFRPVLQKGRIFKEEEDLNVWITDDKNRIPVMAQAKIMVGSIKMELTGYSGLVHPIARLR